MPFPGEHACRIRNPDDFDRFARLNTVDPNVILGFVSDGSSQIQAYRYPVEDWTAEDARNHCNGHEGTFEEASNGQ